MEKSIIDKARQWLDPTYDQQTREEVLRLIEEDPALLEDSFYRNLDFGTGGLRGVMGVGTNRMNRYTVGMVTQGLADYVKKTYPGPHRAAIAYDCRNQSPDFALITAQVLAANDFTVFLYDALRPTPQLSFTVRHLKCQIGVMITASHNPKEYNGYKVYGDDGAQVVAPHDGIIIDQVRKITSPAMVRFSGGKGQIQTIGREMDNLYLDTILSLVNLSPQEISRYRDLKMVYTPLHGTGVHIVPQAFSKMGFTHLQHVPRQEVTDGNFPTVSSPNPEEPEALKMALDKARKTGAHLVMATDPDSDRIGVAVRDQTGDFVLLNGNQTASLLTYYLLEKWKETDRLQGKEYIVKTIVTSDLLQAIASHYGIDCYNVLTGFKYIAEVIRKNEGKKVFICGGEESYGFNVGEYVRDKDAVVTCVLAAEVACWAASRGKTMYDLLKELYVRFGFFKERMVSRTLKGKDGMEQIEAIMKRLRENPPVQLLGSPVVLLHDYKKRETVDMVSDLRYRINLRESDVLQFVSADNAVVTVRPSGTEPKIKYYYGVSTRLDSEQDFEKTSRILDNKLKALNDLFQK
ncbi:MAG: phospho-sugar mutase [Bacteroidales bacterium]|jgi:phosphoglucomutase|nr:phospho-sugar mutase [Bacteroidales bacterium]MDD2263729.1 phospho-sugar mutase [Bacteroidales bacterium]MDD2831053.1 phospho-sugar mutase [Bacteroidales bacterium]MDD3208139.1 phospho-sugar mutase [Bacteroidales bacterium]MDD3696819.1 phospho-sugar mutase [Bacteroidales bacterium]